MLPIDGKISKAQICTPLPHLCRTLQLTVTVLGTREFPNRRMSGIDPTAGDGDDLALD
jgi:hypothetical protein